MSSSKPILRMISRRMDEPESEVWLPDEIIYLIMRKLMSFPMYLARFSAVCKRWNRLIRDSWPKLVQEHQITPLFLLPTVDRIEKGVVKQVSCQIYNLIGNRAPALVNSLPYGFNRIIGSSFGWLIIVREEINYTKISLFNPLSKIHIPLSHPLYSLHGWTLIKGVLSKPPRLEEADQHFDVAVTMRRQRSSWGIHNPLTMIALCLVKKIGKFESTRWEYYECSGDRILDVNIVRGRICTLCTRGTVNYYKWSRKNRRFFTSCRGLIDKWRSRVNFDGDNLASVYLLESSSSEVLVVVRYKSSSTVGFKVLALNLTEEIDVFLKLTEIKTLGNDVIFLSDNGNSVCVKDGSELKSYAGSIYFANEYIDPSQGVDIGVFNVDQNCFTHFTHRLDDTKFIQVSPVWFMPVYDEILKFSSIG